MQIVFSLAYIFRTLALKTCTGMSLAFHKIDQRKRMQAPSNLHFAIEQSNVVHLMAMDGPLPWQPGPKCWDSTLCLMQ